MSGWHGLSGLVLTVALLAEGASLVASPPPEPKGGPANAGTPTKIDWHLEKNVASGMTVESKDGKQTYRVVRAIDVSDLNAKQRLVVPTMPQSKEQGPSPLVLWQKKFGGKELESQNGYASAVDEKVFSDLRMVSAREAEKLKPEGIDVGRVKLKEYDPVELASFLVASGIVDANIHILAAVTGTYSKSDAGHWFALHSDDPYWTNQENHASYDFGLHIAPDGTIRLINRRDVGRLPGK
jgi:hypothetical protein